MLTERVKKILSNYEGEPSGVKQKLAQILMHGRLSGTGRMIILPVDQGFEHGPARSFAPNPACYDPHSIYELAIEGGVNAYAAPLGLLSAGADTFAGEVPLILKVNSSNSLAREKDQSFTSGLEDALRLGCVGIGLTVYPGSDYYMEMVEEAKEMIAEARSYGLLTVVWTYPRGGILDKQGETALDVTAYAAHMACLMGAHIVKVKPPTDHIFGKNGEEKAYADVPKASLEERIAHVVQSCLNGRRLVVFSGGAAKGEAAVYDEVRSIAKGGGSGSIVGRNSFQRSKADGVALLHKLATIYREESV